MNFLTKLSVCIIIGSLFTLTSCSNHSEKQSIITSADTTSEIIPAPANDSLSPDTIPSLEHRDVTPSDTFNKTNTSSPGKDHIPVAGSGSKKKSQPHRTATSTPTTSESLPPPIDKDISQFPMTDNGVRLKNKKWQLFIVNGKEPAPYPVTLVFKDSTFGGMGVCNSYGGKVKYIDYTDLRLFQLSSTEMACEGLQFEQQYFKMLQKVKDYMLLNDTLRLYDGTGMYPAMFVNVH
ncbi:MAG: META domain-containing protein [Bacteroidia bacterium]